LKGVAAPSHRDTAFDADPVELEIGVSAFESDARTPPDPDFSRADLGPLGPDARPALGMLGRYQLDRREGSIQTTRYFVRLLFAMLLLGGVAGASASEVLELRLVGTGLASDDPRQLGAETLPPVTAPGVRDLGGGTWWRGELPAHQQSGGADDQPRVLHFRAGLRAQLTVLWPESGRRIERSRLGDAGPAWGLRSEMPVLLPAAIPAGSGFYLHVSQDRSLPVLVQSSALDDYLGHATTRKVMIATSTTALLTLALLAIVLRRSFGGAAYSHLAWTACLMAGYILTNTGELHQLIDNPTLLAWTAPLQRSFAMLAVASSHLFIISYLELDRRRPRIRRVLLILAAMQATIALISWIEGQSPHRIGALLSNLLILASIPLVLLEAWRAHRDRLQAGRYVLMAWGPALLVLSLWIFALQGWLPPSWLDIAGLVFYGLALQVAVLLLGLADDTARLRRERDAATAEAGHDPLTGVFNRRALQQRLRSLVAQAEATGQPLSVAFLDVDHFKRINDRHGHAAGDQCLCDLVGRVRASIRAGDVLARYGGEEFVVVLPGMTGIEALAWADQLRRDIASLPFQVGAQAVPISASLGVCEWVLGDSIDALLECADRSLYRAKQGGRNQASLWQPQPAPQA
jgi:diguanylate cyclase (GGDEF)-like protein